MTNQNTTIPAALANSAEAELRAFREFLADKAARDFLFSISFDFDNVTENANPADLENLEAVDASEVIAHIDGAIDSIEGLLAGYRLLRDSYLDHMGVPAAIETVVQSLQAHKTEEGVKALQYGLELMWNSQRRLSPQLREALIALGMPATISRRAVDTYRLASCGGWTNNILAKTSWDQADEALVRATIHQSIDALALRARNREESGDVSSATAQTLAYIARDLEGGNYGVRLAAHYYAFCEDARTTNQTMQAAASVIEDIGDITDLRTADDVLMTIIARAGLSEGDGVDVMDMTPEDEANIRRA